MPDKYTIRREKLDEKNDLHYSSRAGNGYDDRLYRRKEGRDGSGNDSDSCADIRRNRPADEFMSAATKQMKALQEKVMIAEDTVTELLENKIVLIVPSGSAGEWKAFEDIEKAESIALGDPASVPAGQYAQEALTSLGIWDGIQDKVSFGTNVTEVLNQVAASSADAGIVYATDAASMAEQVDVIAEAPEGSLSKKVIYPVAVVKDSAHLEEAEAFVEFLKTEEAMKVFESYGFSKGN